MRTPTLSISWIALLIASLVWSRSAKAEDPRAIVLSTRVVESDAPVQLRPLAQRVQSALLEGVVDFGFDAQPSDEVSALPPDPAWFSQRPRQWVFGAEVLLHETSPLLRLFAVPPTGTLWLGQQVEISVQRVEIATLQALRAVMDKARAGSRAPREPSVVVSPPAVLPTSVSSTSEAPSSAGRAVLALHGAALGGYFGFALQRASGDADARLIYPLSALGAGAGLGAAIVVANEWNVTEARAWYLGAAALWPTLGTLRILSDQTRLTETGDRHAYGLLGAASGLALATVGLSYGDVDAGGAALTHSAGLFGFLLGGMLELGIDGDVDAPIGVGPGYGTLAGTLVAGTLAASFEMPSAEEVLFMDLGAVLGGLGAAGLGTPLVVGEGRSSTRDRLWLGGTLAGAIIGGAVGYWAVRDTEEAGSDVGSVPSIGLNVLERGGVQLHISGQW